MNTAPKSQIVHESEAQRQHVRLPFPVKVEINGRTYGSKNISSGGISVQEIEGIFTAGQKLPVSVKIPFSTFSLDMNLEAEIQHYDGREKILGLRFINLTADQISLFNHVMRAFMAGDVVAAGDLLSVAARDNFVKVRKQAIASAANVVDKKQIAGLALLGLLGLIAAGFILGNIYQSLFVIKANDAMVLTPSITLNAPAEGAFMPLVDPETNIVEPGQIIGAITPRGSDRIAGPVAPIPVRSPCDCYVVSELHKDGDYITTGEPVFTLTSADAQSAVIAELDPVRAARIGLSTKADIIIAGSKLKFTGTVSDIRSGLATGASSITGDGGYVFRPVEIKITPEQKIPAELTGRPARVSFTAN